MDTLISDKKNCSYVASKQQFKKLIHLMSKFFGYDEASQISKENELKKSRLRITRDKKFTVALNNEEVDLSQFAELAQYLKEEEMKRQARQDMGIRSCEDDHAYNQRRMNLYKQFFFQLVRKTDDPLINERYEKLRNQKHKPKQMDFFERMRRDQEKRAHMKKIVAKLTTPFRSPPSSTSPSFSRFKSNTFLQPPSDSSLMSRQVSPKFLGEEAKAMKKSSKADVKMNLSRVEREDMIDSKLRALENKVETKSFEEALDEELLLYQ